MIEADELLANAPGKAFIADTGYDSNRFRQASRDKKKRPVIGSKNVFHTINIVQRMTKGLAR